MPKSIPGWLDAPWNADGTQNPDLAGNPQAWNSLIINSERLPGMAIVGIPKHALVSQHGRASGRSPGSPTPRGRMPGSCPVSLHIRNNSEWADLLPFIPRLLPWVSKKGGPPPGAVQAYHPLLAAFGIRWVLIQEIGGGDGPKAGGPCIIRFTLEETEDPKAIKVAQAKPKSTALESAPIIDIAGEAPRPPNLRDLTRKPLANAR